jgi:hypothetical protein
VILSRTLILGSLLAAAAPTGAQPARTQAEALFREGRNLLTTGKTAEACAAFEHSQKLEPAVTTLLNLAACREMLGQLVTAWGLFLDAEDQTRTSRDEVDERLHETAHDHAAKLEARVSKLMIAVPEKSKTERLEIVRDGEPVPAEMWNRIIPVNGGTYKIIARAPGMRDWSTTVQIAPEADSKTVEIPELLALSPGVGGQRGNLVPILVGGGGAALLGGSLGFWLWGNSTYDDAKAEMADLARRSSLYDSANRKRYVAEGLAIAGAGCAGVAVWLYVRQRGATTEPASAQARQVMLVPTISGIGVAGSF